MVALSKAFALAASSDEARVIREEVGFFQMIRAALIKNVGISGKRMLPTEKWRFSRSSAAPSSRLRLSTS